jgi:hypothetical protein
MSSFSRTSKYYHDLADPFLYRDLDFRACDELQIKQLLITLLDKPDLAKHISSFTLIAHCRPTDHDANSNRETESTATVIRCRMHLISETLGRFGGLPFRVSTACLASILTCGGTLDDPSSSIDGATALILLIASNISAVRLAVQVPETLDITRQVLSLQSLRSQGMERPFQKLESFHLQDDVQYDHIYSIYMGCLAQRHVVEGAYVGAIIEPKPPNATLRSLELKHVYINPEMVECIISYSLGLRTLALDQFKRRCWDSYDCARLSRALVIHLPALEVFECTHRSSDCGVLSGTLSSLKPLSKLHTLRVDFDMLFAPARQDNTFDSAAMFPSSLEYLELTNIDPYALNRHAEWHRKGESVHGRTPWHFITNPGCSVDLEICTIKSATEQYSHGHKITDLNK